MLRQTLRRKVGAASRSVSLLLGETEKGKNVKSYTKMQRVQIASHAPFPTLPVWEKKSRPLVKAWVEAE
jgi:hypothetical protein